MKFIREIYLSIICFLLLAFSLNAEVLLGPNLQFRMNDNREEYFPVIIALKPQWNKDNINFPGDKKERKMLVVSELKNFSQTHQKNLLSALREKNASEIEPLWIVNAISCRIKKDLLAEILKFPEVWYVESSFITEKGILGSQSSILNTKLLNTLEWNLRLVGCDSVWQLGFKGDSIIVGHIDTGVNYNHLDLRNHMWVDPNYPKYGWNFELNNDDPIDINGHGTHTAGTIAGDGSAGDTTGAAPKAQIMACRVKVTPSPPFPDTIAENQIFQALQFCISPPRSPTHGADIISMPLGWRLFWYPRRALFRQAITNVATAGLALFAPAGNERGTPPPSAVRTPGDVPGAWKHPFEAPGGKGGAITIGATDANDNIASFSSPGPVSWDTVSPYRDYPYPPGLLKPDLSAPGVNITSLSHTNNSGYVSGWSGTDMASPLVAGIAALVLSKNPLLKPDVLDSILQMTVLPLGSQPKNNDFGTGRVSAYQAVLATPSPSPFHDVGVLVITSPAQKVDTLSLIIPSAILKNYGTYRETNFISHCRIDSSGIQIYRDSITVASLDSGATTNIAFANWTSGPGGITYRIKVWHTLPSDTNRINDSLFIFTTTKIHDVALISTNITSKVRANQSIIPQVTLFSPDYTERDFFAHSKIDSSGIQIYRDSIRIDSIIQGIQTSINFSPWRVGPPGTRYSVIFWHSLSYDQKKTNDTISVSTLSTPAIRVIILYSDGVQPDTLIAGLRALGDSVSASAVRFSTPRLSELAPYDGVICFSNFPFANPSALGDTLASFVDQNRGVVFGTFAFTTGWEIRGRIASPPYAPFQTGANTLSWGNLGWYLSSHPIMSGVAEWRDYFRSQVRFSSDSIAKWNDGKPLIGTSLNKRVVGINSYPGNWTVPQRVSGNWIQAYHNSLLWALEGPVGISNSKSQILNTNFNLAPVFPNPVREKAMISYSIPVETNVNLVIYNVLGERVRSLVSNEKQKPGLKNLIWDGRDNTNKRVSSGIYFLNLKAGNFNSMKKFIILR